jgi:tripartite-type tricarboxylate transporter receptor subunit TctC
MKREGFMNLFKSTAAIALLTAGVSPVFAQPYPAKPVRMLVGIAPGGGLDAGTRTVAGKMAEILSQPFIVENRPGAGGTVAGAVAAKSPPDGYTLLMATTTLMFHPAVYPNLPYDPIKSFTPIGTAGTEVLVFTANPSVPVRTTAELIALLKANPGKYHYGSPGVGTVHHLSMEIFRKQAGVEITHVPYKGAALITPDLLSGQIPFAVMSVNSTVPHARAGKIRAIAISSPVKLPGIDWPAIADTLPGFDAASTRILMAPAGVPREVVVRLSDTLRRMLSSEDVLAAFEKQGALSQFISPEDLAAKIQNETGKWMTAAREAGIKAE